MTVGNIDSTEKGSGARYNDGKPDYSLLMLGDFAVYLISSGEMNKIVDVIGRLGIFQRTRDVAVLFDILKDLGIEAIEESTHVFTYGAKKYAKFNWMKGMNWSVPMACAVRHSLKILKGEDIDEESGCKHTGHIVCNIMMLIQYYRYYKEGDDLPPKEYFQ